MAEAKTETGRPKPQFFPDYTIFHRLVGGELIESLRIKRGVPLPRRIEILSTVLKIPPERIDRVTRHIAGFLDEGMAVFTDEYLRAHENEKVIEAFKGQLSDLGITSVHAEKLIQSQVYDLAADKNPVIQRQNHENLFGKLNTHIHFPEAA